MSDPFSVLGVPARFDLDDATLAAAQKKADASGSAEAREAAAILSDRRRRAEAMLQNLGAPPPEDWVGTPSGFDGVLARLRELSGKGDPSAAEEIGSEIEKHWVNVAHLFVQLGSNDKGTVQMGRQRLIRSELNAIDALSKL